MKAILTWCSRCGDVCRVKDNDDSTFMCEPCKDGLFSRSFTDPEESWRHRERMECHSRIDRAVTKELLKYRDAMGGSQ